MKRLNRAAVGVLLLAAVGYSIQVLIVLSWRVSPVARAEVDGKTYAIRRGLGYEYDLQPLFGLVHYHSVGLTIEDAGGETGDTMKGINEAYTLIMEYCKGYRYSFSREDFERNYPELNYQERFKDDWLGS